MAARVTEEEVKAIIDTTVTTAPFITAANLLVESVLGGESLGDDLLKEIERWLSAHFVAIRDPREKSKKMDEAEAKFFLGKEGKGLEATPYGMQAIALDTTGKLANVGKTTAKVECINWE